MSGTTVEYIRLVITVFTTIAFFVTAIFIRRAVDNVFERLDAIESQQEKMSDAIKRQIIRTGVIEKSLGIETEIDDELRSGAVTIDGGIFMLDHQELENRNMDIKPVA